MGLGVDPVIDVAATHATCANFLVLVPSYSTCQGQGQGQAYHHLTLYSYNTLLFTLYTSNYTSKSTHNQ